MSRIYGYLLAAAMLVPAMVTAQVTVTNGNNDGEGSLRAALASGESNITIDSSVGTITVMATLEYTGTDRLVLTGSGQTLDATNILEDSTPILQISNGASTFISDLTFEAPGGYDIFNQGGGKGIFLDIPEDQTGFVFLRLTNVTVSGTGNHGVHVSDCTLGDDCGGGSGGGGDGSPASIFVQLNNVIIDNSGLGKADADGLRVDDRGDGNIYLSANNSTFSNNGADGVELDEGNNGFVYVNVRNSLFQGNGFYCAPIDPPTPGGPCDDDGDVDVDDAFDVDEAGDGSITGFVRNTQIIDNLDEGLDFDEEDAGGYSVLIADVYASGNADEGIKMSEEGEGGISLAINNSTLEMNNGDSEGAQIEEEQAGDVFVTVRGSTFVGGAVETLRIDQADEGVGTVRVRGSDLTLELDGVEELATQLEF